MKIAAHTMGTPSRTPVEAMELFFRTGIRGIELIMQDEYKCAVPTMVTKPVLRAKLRPL